MDEHQKLRIPWLAPASSGGHLAQGWLLNGRQTEARAEPRSHSPQKGCDPRKPEDVHVVGRNPMRGTLAAVSMMDELMKGTVIAGWTAIL